MGFKTNNKTCRHTCYNDLFVNMMNIDYVYLMKSTPSPISKFIRIYNAQAYGYVLLPA